MKKQYPIYLSFLRGKKETIDEIRKRVLSKCKPVNCGILSPPMSAEVALTELKNHLLGEDWYSMNLSPEQVYADIVYNIECKYKRYRRRSYE